ITMSFVNTLCCWGLLHVSMVGDSPGTTCALGLFLSSNGKSSDKFRSALFLGTCQSFLSSLSALIYILLRKKKLETLIQALISRQELRRGHHSCYLERKSTYHTPMV
ncbi:hypothetical protein GGU11DRAFT_798235, partial [Lentinula aff. detonsa]